jgi:alpha,alpha-trehalose phosphorylase (configuration-retaining)
LDLGLSSRLLENEPAIEVGLAMHDTNYSVDFCVHKVSVPLDPVERADVLTKHILHQIRRFSEEHRCKFIGAGVGKPLFDLVPHLCSTLWKEFDIIPMVLSVYMHEHGVTTPIPPTADEQADSVVRKLIMHFGPRHLIRVQIGFRNLVEVDEGGLVRIVDNLADYERTVRPPTWRACLKIAEQLKSMGTKIAFFSSTPQGGGVALMRHALIRFFKLLGVDAKWYILQISINDRYVPKPNPQVFRITKDNHNILQGRFYRGLY